MTGSVRNRPKSGRIQSATDEEHALDVLQTFIEDPHTSLRKAAQQHDMHPMSVNKANKRLARVGKVTGCNANPHLLQIAHPSRASTKYRLLYIPSVTEQYNVLHLKERLTVIKLSALVCSREGRVGRRYVLITVRARQELGIGLKQEQAIGVIKTSTA
ncbi:hypothetical protein J6590_100111 [Homalodisca vitripennis]|nr:hypothetical protein J6590_100111 [Homalodisca vitripennis]